MPAPPPLVESDVVGDPLLQFRRWFDEAREAGEATPEAMALATASARSAPSARMVLLKAADERGFAFYTGLDSRKADDLEQNPRAALLFHWRSLERQVRIEGAVVPVDDCEADAYWATRPPRSRLSAFVSRQSSVIANRPELEAAVVEAARTPDAADRRPAHWGGFRLVPDVYEFWQHRDDRLHDRLRYRRGGDAWVVERLSP